MACSCNGPRVDTLHPPALTSDSRWQGSRLQGMSPGWRAGTGQVVSGCCAGLQEKGRATPAGGARRRSRMSDAVLFTPGPQRGTAPQNRLSSHVSSPDACEMDMMTGSPSSDEDEDLQARCTTSTACALYIFALSGACRSRRPVCMHAGR